MQHLQKLVGELLTADLAPPRVALGDTVAAAIAVMRAHPVHSVVVTDDDAIVGIFSERDLLTRVYARDLDPAATPIAEVMTPDPVTLPEGADVSYAIYQMGHESLSNVPVVDAAGRLIGLIGVEEVVRHFDEVLAELEAASHVGDPRSPWVDLGGGN